MGSNEFELLAEFKKGGIYALETPYGTIIRITESRGYGEDSGSTYLMGYPPEEPDSVYETVRKAVIGKRARDRVSQSFLNPEAPLFEGEIQMMWMSEHGPEVLLFDGRSYRTSRLGNLDILDE
jgi:hypothetical protein